jgi:hypothetical protein
VLTLHRGICSDRVFRNDRVSFHKLAGLRNADAVESHGLDFARDGGQRTVGQASHRELDVIRAVPIHAGELGAVPLSINDPMARCMERQCAHPCMPDCTEEHQCVGFDSCVGSQPRGQGR